MKAAVCVGVTLSVFASIAQAAAPDISAFLFDVGGSASSSVTTGASGAGTFGPTSGVSGNETIGTATYSGITAKTNATAAGLLNTDVVGSLAPGATQTFSASSTGTWSGRFVNILPTAQTFSLDVLGLNDATVFGFTNSTYAAHLFVGSVDYDLTQLYASITTIGIGTLAPGQGVDLKMTTFASATVDPIASNDAFGSVISELNLTSYNKSPVSPVPEPQTYALLLVGLAGLAWRRAAATRSN